MLWIDYWLFNNKEESEKDLISEYIYVTYTMECLLNGNGISYDTIPSNIVDLQEQFESIDDIYPYHVNKLAKSLQKLLQQYSYDECPVLNQIAGTPIGLSTYDASLSELPSFLPSPPWNISQLYEYMQMGIHQCKDILEYIGDINGGDIPWDRLTPPLAVPCAEEYPNHVPDDVPDDALGICIPGVKSHDTVSLSSSSDDENDS